MKLTFSEIAEAVGGERVPFDGAVASVSTDSRDINPGSLFIALKGDNFDGHDHINEALAKGAALALVERMPDTGLSDGEKQRLILVNSTRRALLDLAAYYRRRLNVKVIAVTGSVGKTTTKDMLASVLSQKYKTFKTPGNKNNLIGLPLTLLSLDESHETAVIEMGMNHFGEIHELSLTAAPDICVITNIGDSHIEFLGSREGILKAKLEITDGMKPGGKLILNGDDSLLGSLGTRFPDAVYCSLGDYTRSAVRASALESLGLAGVGFNLHIHGGTYRAAVPLPGGHMVTNALLAAAAGDMLGLSPAQIINGMAAFTPTDRRMSVHEVHGMRIIDDAYNASPASVRAAVSVLAGIKEAGRRVCVLGDMLELGSHSERLHRETGEYILNAGIDLVIAVGDKARYYINNNPLWFKDNDTFLEHWKELLKPDDTVLFKASFGMDFRKIIQGVLA